MTTTNLKFSNNIDKVKPTKPIFVWNVREHHINEIEFAFQIYSQPPEIYVMQSELNTDLRSILLCWVGRHGNVIHSFHSLFNFNITNPFLWNGRVEDKGKDRTALQNYYEIYDSSSYFHLINYEIIDFRVQVFLAFCCWISLIRVWESL